MKPFLLTMAVVSGLIVVAHVARVAAEGAHPLHDPVFLVATVVSALICGWAVVLLRKPAAKSS